MKGFFFYLLEYKKKPQLSKLVSKSERKVIEEKIIDLIT